MRHTLIIFCTVVLHWIPACTTAPGNFSAEGGINQAFLDPDLNVQEFIQRFETESREIFLHRHEITAAVGLQPGMAVADVGAGTGFFTKLFAQAVGKEGTVYAVEIAPRFIEHIEHLARSQGLSQVHTVKCQEDSVDLPPESIDAAFICDTYHHFEYPDSSMQSIHDALRSRGELIVIDFHRIEGVSRDWILEHVRADQEVFAAEIEACGFRRVHTFELEVLTENYFMRFVKE